MGETVAPTAESYCRTDETTHGQHAALSNDLPLITSRTAVAGIYKRPIVSKVKREENPHPPPPAMVPTLEKLLG